MKSQINRKRRAHDIAAVGAPFCTVETSLPTFCKLSLAFLTPYISATAYYTPIPTRNA